MKVLSIMQPWAWLIVHGYKDVENRTWATNHRGPLLIHASRTVDADAYDYLAQLVPQIELPSKNSIDRGAIIGGVHLVNCTREITSPVWHQSGMVGWYFSRNVLCFSEPFQCKGALGLWTAPESLTQSLEIDNQENQNA